MAPSTITVSAAQRDRRRANMRHLMNPRSIAFVGGKGNDYAVNYCRDFGFKGDLWTVHPKHQEIGGVPCVSSIDDLPAIPDTVWIAIASEHAVTLVGELAAMGVPSAICYTAGFGEAGRDELEHALADAAGDMALLGPNCMGMINFLEDTAIVAGTHGFARCDRGIACIAQSGTIVANMVTSDRSLPISHMLSMGNQTVLDLADGIEAALDDARVHAIMLYVEGLKDADAFARAVKRAYENDIPIICLKGGVSEAGQAIALSHTGSLAGTPALYQAFLERLGVITVDSFPELLEMSKLLGLGGLPKGNRLMLETCSGTDSGYCADMAERYGVALPQPSAEVTAELVEVLPPIATAMNPLDVTMMQWGNREAQAKSLLTLLKQPADAAALIINVPFGVDSPTYQPALDAMLDVRRDTHLPCYVISNLPEGLPLASRERLIAHGVIPLQGIEDAFSCIGRAARYVASNERLRRRGGPECRLLGTGRLRPGMVLDESASKHALASHGVSVPPSELVDTIDQALATAARLGFPVVVKGHGQNLAHKSELGAVAVNLSDAAAVRAAASSVQSISGVESLLIESMVTDAVAEIIVGIKRDQSLGLALVIGAGGVLTELLRDTRHLILPVSEDDIADALNSLHAAPLLQGYRGTPAGDMDALVQNIAAIADYASTNASSIIELDVNPLLVRPAGRGVMAVDALIVMGEPEIP